MQRWNDLADVPQGWGPSVVTLGNFDGVHTGHRAVLGRTVEAARAAGARAVAVTFDPHPLQVLRPERAPQLITGLQQRLTLIEATDMDAALVLAFTPELAAWEPEQFVRLVLVQPLRASAVVVGRDMRFGHRGSGDVSTLAALGAQHGFVVEVVEDLAPDDGSRRASSGWVRELLSVGDVATAAVLLGRPHRVSGRVVHGDHRGRELGYPTANLDQDVDGMVPADGVYAGWLLRPSLAQAAPERLLPAAISIGTSPTFDGVQRRVEAYALDRTDLDLYGEDVSLELVHRLRPTVRFDDVPALVEQMAQDVAQCRELLGGAIVPEQTAADPG